jgi:pimeloyl-ACP methyl ester carboxylesterase
MIFKYLVLATLLLATPVGAASRMIGDLPRKDDRPLENIAGLETEYSSVRISDGYRLRVLLTRPAGAAGRLPAIFHTQAVSCGSLELPSDRPTFLGELVRRSGMVLIRVERAGTGDSEGPGCDALDYDTEVRHYREALDQIVRHPWIDADRIFLYGSSLGSTTAPLVAEGRRIAGIVVQGGGAFTYLERMINFDRLYLERSGKYPPEAIHDEMVRRIAFHQLYLIGAKTPGQVVAERPDLAGVWESIRGGAEAPPHYGRPYAWHWQAARRNFAAAWARVDAPVLVAYAEYDQFEPRSSHQAIVDIVNRQRPGTARLLDLPGLDHSLRRYPDAIAAYAEGGGEPGREELLGPMIEWLKAVASRR